MWNNPVEQLLWNDPFEQYVRSLTDEDIQRMKETSARRIGWSVEDLDALYELLEEQIIKGMEEQFANLAPYESSIREKVSNKAKTHIENSIQ